MKEKRLSLFFRHRCALFSGHTSFPTNGIHFVFVADEIDILLCIFTSFEKEKEQRYSSENGNAFSMEN